MIYRDGHVVKHRQHSVKDTYTSQTRFDNERKQLVGEWQRGLLVKKGRVAK